MTIAPLAMRIAANADTEIFNFERLLDNTTKRGGRFFDSSEDAATFCALQTERNKLPLRR